MELGSPNQRRNFSPLPNNLKFPPGGLPPTTRWVAGSFPRVLNHKAELDQDLSEIWTLGTPFYRAHPYRGGLGDVEKAFEHFTPTRQCPYVNGLHR